MVITSGSINNGGGDKNAKQGLPGASPDKKKGTFRDKKPYTKVKGK